MALRRSGVRIPSAPWPLVLLRRWIQAGIASVLLSIAISHTCPGQTTPSRPEAIVLVQPIGTVIQVVVTYRGSIDDTVARGHAQAFARLAGGRISSLTVKRVDVSDARKRSPDHPVQTSLEMMLEGGSLLSGTGINLQPVVAGLRGLRSLEFLLMVPPIPGFDGLRRYDSDGVHIELIHEGNPYRYTIDIKPGAHPVPVIPAHAPVEPTPRASPQQQAAPPRTPILIVAVLGVGAGLAVYIAMRGRADRPQGRS